MIYLDIHIYTYRHLDIIHLYMLNTMQNLSHYRFYKYYNNLNNYYPIDNNNKQGMNLNNIYLIHLLKILYHFGNLYTNLKNLLYNFHSLYYIVNMYVPRHFYNIMGDM